MPQFRLVVREETPHRGKGLGSCSNAQRRANVRGVCAEKVARENRQTACI
jgi:hypothetical protein